MNQATTATEHKAKKTKTATAVEDTAENATMALQERVEHVRDMVEDVRDRAAIAFRDKPYLVPVAAGAVGFGIGVLFGSKLTRLVVMTAVGGVLSEVLGGEVRRIAGEYLKPLADAAVEGVKEA